MEQQNEISRLDLSRWVIVHESPFLGWIGEVEAGDEVLQHAPRLPDRLVLQGPLVLHTTQIPHPGPGGQMQMGIITSVMPPHSLTTDDLLITIKPQGVTLVSDLNSADQASLKTKIENARTAMLEQRAKVSGIVLGGGR